MRVACCGFCSAAAAAKDALIGAFEARLADVSGGEAARAVQRYSCTFVLEMLCCTDV